MKINISNFKDLIKKSTLNFSLENVQLKFGEGRVKCNMMSSNSNCIVILDLPNNVLSINDEVDFNLSDPSKDTMPYLNLFEAEEVDIKLYDNRILLKDIERKQKSSISFCSPIIINKFGFENINVKDEDWLTEMKIGVDFVTMFNKIKKVGARFSKVYFTSKDGVFYIETTDKSNEFSNGLSFDLMEVDIPDVTLCFTFKDIVNLMNTIDYNYENFNFKFSYIEAQDRGMLYAYNTDKSENYCLLSTGD